MVEFPGFTDDATFANPYRERYISNTELTSTIEIAKQIGLTVVTCKRWMLDQDVIAINAEDNSASFWFRTLGVDLSSPETGGGPTLLNHHSVGLQYEGASRKLRRLQKATHMDVPPSELSPGDRVLLRVPTNDWLLESQPIESITAP